jgi:NADP-dependent 3-hydroxy acid dehydrogenase YdfG
VQSDIAIITGASKGIGRSVAKQLAKKDLEVLAVARNESQLISLQDEILKDNGTCTYLSFDLRKEHDLKQLIDFLKNRKLKIRILIHNAGIARVGSVADMPLTDWQDTLDINVTVPFYLTQKCIPLLHEKAHIFFINSVAGLETFSDWSAYCVSKWGLRALADTLRTELAEKGIKVTSIYPSSVDTPMQDQLPYNWDRSKMLKADDVAKAIIDCYLQPEHVYIKELELQSSAGTF